MMWPPRRMSGPAIVQRLQFLWQRLPTILSSDPFLLLATHHISLLTLSNDLRPNYYRSSVAVPLKASPLTLSASPFSLLQLSFLLPILIFLFPSPSGASSFYFQYTSSAPSYTLFLPLPPAFLLLLFLLLFFFRFMPSSPSTCPSFFPFLSSSSSCASPYFSSFSPLSSALNKRGHVVNTPSLVVISAVLL